MSWWRRQNLNSGLDENFRTKSSIEFKSATYKSLTSFFATRAQKSLHNSFIQAKKTHLNIDSIIPSRSLFRSGDVQGGLDSYQRAVAQYKLAGDWDTAALTLTKMGEIFRKQGKNI